MSNDYTSQMLQWIMDQAAAGQGQPLPAYEGKPSGVVQDQARRVNLYQDMLSIGSDMANSALVGPQAFAPGAFDSTSTYAPVDQPGTQALNAYAARANTPEGIIAAGILSGSTAQAEIAKLQQAYTEADKNGTLADNPILSQIPMGPPSQYDGTILPDWGGLQTRMGDVESAYFTESQGGQSGALYDPTTGEFVGGGNRQTLLDENGNPVLADVETTPSAAAQWYAEQGLSPPDQQYQAADLMDPNQAQYMDTVNPANEQWLQAMQNWQNETMALPPPDAGKAGLSAAPPTYDKGQQQQGAASPAGAPESTGWQSLWSGVGGDVSNLQDRLTETPVANTNAAPPMVNAAITAAQLAPDVGSWWARNGATPQEAVTGIAGGLGGFINDVWNSYAGNDQSFGRRFGNEQFDADGNPVQWNPNAPYETAFNDRVAQMLAERGATAPPQGQDPTGLISDDAWAAAQASGANLRDSQTPGTPLAPLDTNDLAAVFANGQGVGNAGPAGVGGAGAGGGGAPRGINDLPGPDLPSYPDVAAQHQQPGVPPGGYVHNGAIFDAQDHLVGYVDQPQQQTSNASTRTGPEPSDQGGRGIPSGGYVHNGAVFDAMDRLVGYTPAAQQSQQQQPGGSNPATQALIQQLLSGSQGGAHTQPSPTSNTSTRTGPEPSEQAPSTAGAPPGGYVHNGAIFDAQDRLVGYTSEGGGGTPSSQQLLGIMGQQPQPYQYPGGMPGYGEPVRIGKGRQDQRTNAPTVRDRYPKPKARDTAQSRMAQENANTTWQRTRQAQRAAGIGTGAYGRAAAVAYLLQQQGITPSSTQLAARRAATGF